jgi:CHRD domain
LLSNGWSELGVSYGVEEVGVRSRVLVGAVLVVLGVVVASVVASARGVAMSPVVSAKLLGKNEVPKGSPTGSGLAVLHLDAKKGTVCWLFSKVSKIDKPLVSHIHKGAAGTAGPVVIPLGGAYKAKGCTKASSKLITAIEEKPGAYYVNIHTKKYPGGAIRGPLVAGMHG